MKLATEVNEIAKVVEAALAINQWYKVKEGDSDFTDLSDEIADYWNNREQNVIENLGNAAPFDGVKATFKLSNREVACLLILSLVQLDNRLCQALASLQESHIHQGLSCDTMVGMLCDDSEKALKFRHHLLHHSPLVLWGLVRISPASSPLSPQLLIAPELLDLAIEYHKNRLDESPQNQALELPAFKLNPVLHPVSCQHIPGVSQPMVLIIGESGSGRRIAAQHLAGDRQVMEIDQQKLLAMPDGISALTECLRVALVSNQLIYWPNGLSFLSTQRPSLLLLIKWLALTPNNIPAVVFSEPEHIAIPSELVPYKITPILSTITAIEQKVRLLNRLAQHFLPTYPKENQTQGIEHFKQSQNECDVDWQQVVENYNLNPAKMMQLMSTLVGVASEKSEITQRDVWKVLADMSASSLSSLASKKTAKVTLAELVINPRLQKQFDEIIARYRLRNKLLNANAIKNVGFSSLFWGRPGTGKTIGAEAIAQHLGLPLYQVNLSNIASKWIGETEKNLAQLFDDAEQNQGVLFFDEADAVFSKRTNVESSHDKTSNLGVSFLLQRMEAFTGVLILATNFKGNLDEAFLRRFQFSCEFTLPDEQERRVLWQRAFKAPYTLTDDIVEDLVTNLAISPANIANIARHTVLLSMMSGQEPSASKEPSAGQKQLTVDHLADAILREHQKLDSSYLIESWLKKWRAEHQVF